MNNLFKFLFLTGIVILSGCSYSKQIHSLFSNKIIGYSATYENDADSYEFCYYFIAYYNDSIRYVHDNWGNPMKDIDHLDTVFHVNGDIEEKPVFAKFYQVSDLPYQLKKTNRRVIIQYTKGSEKIAETIYSLNKRDSIRLSGIDVLCSGSDMQNGLSALIKDTAINLYGHKLKCYVFEEYYIEPLTFDSDRSSYIIRVYREKNTLLPLMQKYVAFKNEDFTNQYTPSIEQISFITKDPTRNIKAKWIKSHCE